MFVGGDDLAAVQAIGAAGEIADDAARLAHQHDARRHVPEIDVALPIAVEAAGRRPGEVQRGGAEAAHARR